MAKCLFPFLMTFLLFLSWIPYTKSVNGFDLNVGKGIPKVDSFRCLVNYGTTFAVIGSFSSYGTLFPSASQALRIAQSLGLKTDVYMDNCPGKDPIAQANELMDGIPNNLFNRVWILVQPNYSPGCGWPGKTPQANCQYLKSMITAIQNRGKTAGILSSASYWANAFKSTTACYQVADGSVPVWYIATDGVKSFTGFQKFGGWTSPTMKTWSDTVDDQNCQVSFHPVFSMT